MGTREEGKPSIIIRGYSGRIRPEQAECGKCKKCKEPVFVDLRNAMGTGSTVTDRVAYVHYGCDS